MQIIRHPDYEGEESPDLAIARDQQGLRRTLDALPGWARAATEQSDEFWRTQRIATWSRISWAEERSARRIPTLAWTVAAAIIAVSGWLLEQPMVAPPREVYVDPDHELLMEVERMVQIDGPLALEPAALLAQEMVQDLPARNYPVRKKEPRHEN
jgi:hypothetical protein